MKPNLKKYNSVNSRPAPVGVPYIHLNGKTGVIAFSRKAAEVVGLIDQCGIAIYQDEDSPRDWFIALDNDDQALTVRQTKAGFCFNNSGIARRILEHCGVPPTTGTTPPRNTAKMSASMQITSTPTEIEGVKYYLIVTSKPLTQR